MSTTGRRNMISEKMLKDELEKGAPAFLIVFSSGVYRNRVQISEVVCKLGQWQD